MTVQRELRHHLRRDQSQLRFEPCLPRLAKEPPAGPGWLHEIKHDGFRIIAHRDGANGHFEVDGLYRLRTGLRAGLRGHRVEALRLTVSAGPSADCWVKDQRTLQRRALMRKIGASEGHRRRAQRLNFDVGFWEHHIGALSDLRVHLTQ